MPPYNLRSRRALPPPLRDLLEKDVAHPGHVRVRRILARAVVVAWVVATLIMVWVAFPHGRHSPLTWSLLAVLCGWALLSLVAIALRFRWLGAADASLGATALRAYLARSRSSGRKQRRVA